MVEEENAKREREEVAGGARAPEEGGERPPAKKAKEEVTNEIEFACTSSLEGHDQSVSYLSFSPDGKQLASCSSDQSVIIWNPHQQGQLVRRIGKESAGDLGAHDRGISCVAWSPDGGLLCTASDDQTLRLWEAETGRCAKVLRGHTHFVMCCDFSTKGNMLVSGSMDETIRIWEVRSGELLKEVPAHSDPVTSVKFSPDSSMFVSSSYDGLCRVWDTETGKCLQTVYISNNTPASSAAFTPNDHYLVINHFDSAIRLWDLRRAKWVKKYTGHRNEKFCCMSDVFSHADTDTDAKRLGGPYIAAGSEDSSICLWNVNTQKMACKIKCTAKEEEQEQEKEVNVKEEQEKAAVVLALSCNPKFPMIASCNLQQQASNPAKDNPNPKAGEETTTVHSKTGNAVRIWSLKQQQQQQQ
jgi:COMPASS component SWD3